MPRLVAFTTRPAPASAPSLASQAATSTGTAAIARSASASSSALPLVRLASRSPGTPASSSAVATARAPPPVPSSTAGPAPGRQPGACARRLARKPSPSVFRPSSEPSGRTSTVLTAPIRSAAASRSSTSRNAASLCGMVTFHPRNPTRGSARKASPTSSGRTGSGT